SQGLARAVVNHLRIDVVERAVYVEPRALPRTLEPLPQALMNPPANFVFRNFWNHVVTLCFVQPRAARSSSQSRTYLELSNLVIFNCVIENRLTLSFSFTQLPNYPLTNLFRSGFANLLLQSLAHVADTLLLIRIRGTQAAHLRCNLSHFL